MCEGKMYKHKHMHGTKLKEVHFIPTHAEHERAEGKAFERLEHKKVKTPEFVRDDYEQGVAKKNKGASGTSLLVTHGRK